MTGQNTARPPHSEQTGMLAVVDDIRFRHRAVSPLSVANGGRPCPPCLGAAPNFIGRSRVATGGKWLRWIMRLHNCTPAARVFPRRKRNRTVIADCRASTWGRALSPEDMVE